MHSLVINMNIFILQFEMLSMKNRVPSNDMIETTKMKPNVLKLRKRQDNQHKVYLSWTSTKMVRGSFYKYEYENLKLVSQQYRA